jgi:hypothetical protein
VRDPLRVPIIIGPSSNAITLVMAEGTIDTDENIPSALADVPVLAKIGAPR